MSEAPYYRDESVTLHHGDCLDVLRDLPDCSVDSVVTDPPYGLGFMGREWDSLPPGKEWATECLRVLKPGGHMLAFGGSRTWHRLQCAVEDSGFEIRDSIAWLYGSGFPKSLDVSKAIDKATGAEREIAGRHSAVQGRAIGIAANDGRCLTCDKHRGSQPGNCHCDKTGLPVTDEARRWDGWGTALKPAFEPIVVARKPLQGTVAANVLQHGTGALNIDACRTAAGAEYRDLKVTQGGNHRHDVGLTEKTRHAPFTPAAGRWPTNVVMDESQAAELDRQTGTLTSGANPTRRSADRFRDTYGEFKGQAECTPARGADSGGASRFFPTFRYEAKAPTSERPAGEDGTAHPTVKPLDLMRWLVRLVTPSGGIELHERDEWHRVDGLLLHDPHSTDFRR